MSNTLVPRLSFVIGSEILNAEAYGCVQLIGTIITWFLSGSLLVQCYGFFCTDHLNEYLKFIKVAAFIQILVWSIGLTGIGESATQPILQRTDLAIDRILHCSDFFCLANMDPEKRVQNLSNYFTHDLLGWRPSPVAFMQLAAAIARGVALVQAKLESSFESTKRIIDRLIIVTLETAAVTLIMTLVHLIFYLRSPPSSLNRLGMYNVHFGGLRSEQPETCSASAT
ncbi:uncharacterized protein LACBIDRAFT_332211 [Laccaria bicolor S238N-H82]|uniref:Predicted protein n=1 Tax=Laccaria bicolor (strain S238N-H82 / ATCC MYA-4686) TaxID=486041 RepID=B0DRY9_LACBS|nr:uncharacterized protein LACBIDRAFT_332211 [Laccaria bicolor S238N-H82]EDR02610.1 predicted protein [Laccaria bicolor S238N-H82]|eukprot:XP_001886654.1 predicted protein [Laccaria bicolor S238N-H82]